MIHELNCGTMRPPSELLTNGRGSLWRPARLGCRCLLVQTGAGWTLVDTGLGTADLRDPVGRLGASFLANTRPALDPAEPAIRQLPGLGIDPRTVTDIVLTHHDVDHVGGIADFPWARVHLSGTQLSLITPSLHPELVHRLHPPQWSHGPRWAPADLEAGGERYAGRAAARVGDRVRLVELGGHVAGHCGVVIERPGESDLIHAGDAIFSHRTLSGRAAPLVLARFERAMRTDQAAWRASRRWLRDRWTDGVEIVTAHDPVR